MKSILIRSCMAAVIILLGNSNTHGAEYNATVRAGLGSSDNISLENQGEVDETISSLGFEFGVIEETRRLEFSIQSDFDYLDYADGSFDSELVGGINGLAEFNLIDEKLAWVVEDNFGQSLSDPLQPSRPDNRQDVNLFSTGPSLSFVVANRNPVIMDLRYSRLDFETETADNSQLSALISVGRDVSRVSRLSANFDASRIEFESSDVIPPVELYEVFGRWETTGNRSILGIDIGVNQVEFAGNNGDGLVARIDYTRETSSNSTFSFRAGTQYSQQGNIFALYRNVTGDLTNTSNIAESPAPFRSNFAILSYDLDQARFLIETTLDWFQEDYSEGQGLDRDVYRGILSVRRDVTRTLFARVFSDFLRSDFRFVERRDDDLRIGFSLGYQISPSTDVSLSAFRFQRNSSTPGADFTENRSLLQIAYTPAWGR